MGKPSPSPARRRKILVISPFYGAEGDAVGRATGRLLAEITSAEPLHFIWAASGADKKTPPTAAERKASPALLPMQGPVVPGGRGAWLSLCWDQGSRARLRDAVAEADLVWLHDAFFMGGIAGFRAARRAGKPVLLTQHKGPAQNGALGFLAGHAGARATGTMLKNANQASFVSDTVAEHYHRRFAFKAPIKIIPYGIDTALFRPASIEKRRDMRNRFAFRDTTPVLLFAGRFRNSHGLAAIRRLALLLPEWRFWLAGDGPADPEAWFLPNVQVFRRPSEAQRIELYQSADRLILPVNGGDFPPAIQEAMACGLPVLTSEAVANGNRLATPHILTAPVTRDAGRTAIQWASMLTKQRAILPLIRPKTELADIAHLFWPWPKIAGYYADILGALLK